MKKATKSPTKPKRSRKLITQEDLRNSLCLEGITLACRKMLFRKLADGYTVEPGEFDMDRYAEREFIPCVTPSLDRFYAAIDECASLPTADCTPSLRAYRRSYRRRRQELKQELEAHRII